jgi:hypothetical protein
MTLTKCHVVTIAVGLLLASSGSSFAAPKSRHPSSAHSKVRRKKPVASQPLRRVYRHLIPEGLPPIRLVLGSTFLIRTDRMAIQVAGSKAIHVRALGKVK